MTPRRRPSHAFCRRRNFASNKRRKIDQGRVRSRSRSAWPCCGTAIAYGPRARARAQHESEKAANEEHARRQPRLLGHGIRVGFHFFRRAPAAQQAHKRRHIPRHASSPFRSLFPMWRARPSRLRRLRLRLCLAECVRAPRQPGNPHIRRTDGSRGMPWRARGIFGYALSLIRHAGAGAPPRCPAPSTGSPASAGSGRPLWRARACGT